MSRETEITKEVDEQTLTISVKVDGMAFNRSLADELKVSPDAINEYLIRNPGKTAYWTTWHGKAKIVAARLKTQYEETLAAAREAVRENARTEYVKALSIWANLDKDAQQGTPKPTMPTVSEVDDRAMLSDMVQEANRQMLKANEVVQLLGAAVTAIRDLSSTLVSLSANMRQELKSLNNTVAPNNTMRAQGVIRDASKQAMETISSAFPNGRAAHPPQKPSTPTGTKPDGPAQPFSPIDAVLGNILGKDKAPGPGYHKGPDGQWYPEDVQFDENGNKIPF